MDDNWIVENLENALATWNEKLAEIWQLVRDVYKRQLADILCGNRVLVAGIADEAVFLYPAKINFVDDIFAFERA